jgi:hypothetical protein
MGAKTVRVLRAELQRPRSRSAAGSTIWASRGGRYPPRGLEAGRSHFEVCLQIINDPTAPSGDRLRAMEQLESRALGKPKETVEQVNDEPENSSRSSEL